MSPSRQDSEEPFSARELPCEAELSSNRPLAGAAIETILAGFLEEHRPDDEEARAALLAQHPELRERLAEALAFASILIEDAEIQPSPGLWIGEYQLVRRIASGGMGVVWLAHQERLDRDVAIKIMASHLLGSDDALARFRREARMLAQIQDPHVVRVIDCGEEEGLAWMAMEYIPGRGLDELLEDAKPDAGELSATKIDATRILRWGVQVATALQSAHGQGVYHRDVKPSNIRIDSRDEAVLIDFGLGRRAAASSQALTRGFQGSPRYCAPEQVRGDITDARTDVYGLGATLYECFALEPAMKGESTERVLYSVVHVEPEPLFRRKESLPRDVAVVIHKALEKRPQDRYQTVGELAEDLQRILEIRPIRAHAPNPWKRRYKWACRHRLAAASLLLAFVALLALPSYILVNRLLDAAERQRIAEAAWNQAQGELAALQQLDASIERALDELTQSEANRARRAATPAAWQDFWQRREELQLRVAAAQIERRQIEHRLKASIARAMQNVADEDRARGIEVEACLAQLRIAQNLEASRQPFTLDWLDSKHDSQFYRSRLRALGPDSRSQESLDSKRPEVRITTQKPGATLHLFRYVSCAQLWEGGADRYVPVPFRAQASELAVRPGSYCLDVQEAAGQLEVHDQVFEIEGEPLERTVWCLEGVRSLRARDRILAIGGESVVDRFHALQLLSSSHRERTMLRVRRSGQVLDCELNTKEAQSIRLGDPRDAPQMAGWNARAWRKGEIVELRLAPNARFRWTAAPLLRGPQSEIGPTPQSAGQLSQGDYLVVLDRKGAVSIRRLLPDLDTEWSLPPAVEQPEGFVYLEFEEHLQDGARVRRSWIMEREVTSGEYLDFLNQPETLREIAVAKRPTRYPRSRANDPESQLWRFDAARGRYELSGDFEVDTPVVGVSFEDARAYARWLTRDGRVGGGRYRFRLPTRAEWNKATSNELWLFPWGNSFRPTWSKGCFARQNACLEPVWSYPVDETPLGLFDSAGSASEWIDDWISEELGFRTTMGGSWLNAKAETLRPANVGAARSGGTHQGLGFRLVAVARAASESSSGPQNEESPDLTQSR
jgi:serine/threonine protein kinase/formylglycine-generating enzyme required for sulfatase activity